MTIKGLRWGRNEDHIIVEMKVTLWFTEYDQDQYVSLSCYDGYRDSFLVMEKPVFERLASAENVFDELDILKENSVDYLDQDAGIEFDEDYAYTDAMKICIAAEEHYREHGGKAEDFIKPYIGMKAVDAVKKMLPSENERQMWENELQNKIRKAAEDIYFALHKAVGRGYRGIEIKVNSMGDIEARDEEQGEIFNLTYDGTEFVK